MSGDHTIIADGLTKHYGEVKAVVDLNLTIDRGDVFGFLGPQWFRQAHHHPYNA